MKIEISPVEYEKHLNWSDANMYCQLLEIDGKTDWRLPTLKEFEDIYQSYYTITIIQDDMELRPVKKISNFDANYYWTFTHTGMVKKVYFFVMYTGENLVCPNLNNKFCARPVRDL